MGKVRVNVLGPVQVERDGVMAQLSPRAERVLVRLVAAGGQPVGVRQLRWDLWREKDQPHNARNGRNQVQKGVSELRSVLDPGKPGAAGAVLRTERVYRGRETQSAYRLTLDAESLDAKEFSALVGEAMRGAAASAAEQLTRAVSLWRGRPLPEAGDDQYAAGLAEAWQAQYLTALRELVRVQCKLERFDLALPVAERLVAELPDDLEAAAGLAAVRGKIRERYGDVIFQRDFPELRTSLAIIRGDLFDQRDAHLVVGFADTFDVDTRGDLVISRTSLQGQLVDRLYGGDVEFLNRELRRGLSAIAPAARETSRTKPRGKRIRYPIGTVVAIPHNGRRVFATAYSRLGNDLVARARPQDLTSALNQVWESAARFGQLAPIAVPVMGSGLSRITELGQEELIGMIAESFLDGCRKHSTVASALRIVLRPADLERTDMTLVAKAISALDG
jgi:DNA-binding SARP family transcriptional activator